MKKLLIIVVVIVIAVVLILSFLFLRNNETSPEQYTVDIQDSQNIVMIKYQHHSGDVYEITEKDLIQKFIKSINGMTFIQKDDLSNSSWTSGQVDFYNSSGECLGGIAVLNEKTILRDSCTYESDEEYELHLLDNAGEFIENIYTGKK